MYLVLNQVYAFLIMFFYGVFIGFVFDIYLKIAGSIRKRWQWLFDIFDILFGLITGFMGFVLLLYANRGNLRIFVFLAIFTGFIMYFLLKVRVYNGKHKKDTLF